MAVPQIRGIFLGVLISRTTIFWAQYFGVCIGFSRIWGNYQIGLVWRCGACGGHKAKGLVVRGMLGGGNVSTFVCVCGHVMLWSCMREECC